MDTEKLGRAFLHLPATAAGRSTLLGGFALGVAGALTAGTLLRRVLRSGGAGAEEEAQLDDAVADSFPASDPPAGARPHPHDGGKGPR